MNEAVKYKSKIVDVEFGQNVKVVEPVNIYGCKIGDNCFIGPFVEIQKDVTIGNNVKVQNNVSIYDGVTLENDIFCGPSMVFTNVYNPRSAVSRKKEYRRTVVKNGATLGANCTIVCGVTIGEYSFIAPQPTG